MHRKWAWSMHSCIENQLTHFYFWCCCMFVCENKSPFHWYNLDLATLHALLAEYRNTKPFDATIWDGIALDTPQNGLVVTLIIIIIIRNNRGSSSRRVVFTVWVCGVRLPVCSVLTAQHSHGGSASAPMSSPLIGCFSLYLLRQCRRSRVYCYFSFGTKSERKENTVKSSRQSTAAQNFYFFAFSLMRALVSFSSLFVVFHRFRFAPNRNSI